MSRVTVATQSFNGGIVSKTSFGRTDVAVLLKSAEEMENWLPKPLGNMQARPGFERMGTGAEASWLWPFVYNETNTNVLEFRAATLRIWSGDDRITRAAATMSITEGDFDNSLAGWTVTTPGSTTAVASGDNLVMTATGDDIPLVEQQITVAAGTHAVKIIVARGPVRFGVGSTQGDDDLFGFSSLDTGEHHLQWVSTGSSFWIQFASETSNVQRIVDSIAVAATGDVSITTPWGASDLSKIRFQQIGDVIFCAHPSYRQRKIERRANDSWSVTEYLANDGPYLAVFTHRETMALTATTGNTTLTASGNVFRDPEHVGCLFQLTHNTQSVSDSFSANNATSEYVRITGGSEDDRTIDITIDFTTGSFVGTIEVERAFGDPISYNTWQTYPDSGGDIDTTLDETNDDRIVFVRMRVTAYTSGTAAITLFAPQGETLGVVRVTGVTNATTASVEVLTQAGDTTAVNNWREGEWSDANLWPSVACEHDGRLWWAGSNKIWGSASDDYYSFDEEIEGDSAPLNRTIGGQVADVQWMLSGEELLIGTSMAERTGKASSFGEPITRDAFTIRPISTYGSAPIQAHMIDGRGFSVDRDTVRPLVIGYDDQQNRYATARLDFMTENLLSAGVKTIQIQRRPHTRVWYLMEDGTIYVMLYEPGLEAQVQAFYKISARDHTFASIAVEPNASSSDSVWVVAVDGDSNAVVWRMFSEFDAVGGDVNKMVDDAVVYTSLASTSLTGLSHLNGEYPGLWIDGAPVKPTAAVASGSYTHSATVTNGVAGRPYTCRWKSPKVAYGGEQGTALEQPKLIQKAGIIGTDICLDGIRIGIVYEGSDYEENQPLQPIVREEVIAAGTVFSQLDYELEPFDATYETDPRITIENIAPNPANILNLIMVVETEVE